MSKKIAAGAERERDDVYPWLRLLELEVQPPERALPRRGRGRPPNPFPRKSIHVTMTDEELAALDGLAGLLTGRLDARLHRGHVIAFMTFYLRSRLQKGAGLSLPEGVNSLSDLAKYLDKMKD
jgi:hypothetical protein